MYIYVYTLVNPRACPRQFTRHAPGMDYAPPNTFRKCYCVITIIIYFVYRISIYVYYVSCVYSLNV